MLKKTLKSALIGFLIGVVIGNVIAILTGKSDTGGVTFASQKLLDMSGGNVVVAMLLQSLFSGLYGAACFAQGADRFRRGRRRHGTERSFHDPHQQRRYDPRRRRRKKILRLTGKTCWIPQ